MTPSVAALAHSQASARLARVNEIRLRFPGSQSAELVLGTGMHGIGRSAEGDGLLVRIDEAHAASVRFCLDRRGVWITVREGFRGVHVNGRPVQRMAMLRVGDSVHVDGAEIVLMGAALMGARPPIPPPPTDPLSEAVGDPRVLLRGVGGRYHGRSFTLERPRLVGSGSDADLRIDEPGFARRHASIGLHGDAVLLRDLGSETGSLVNGEPVRDALLQPGDQIVFDAHHRFVIEAPGRASAAIGLLPALDDHDVPEFGDDLRQALGRSARRLPWLLLAALLLAAALSALLLFGVSG